jgi:putative two-component system response regulator
MDLNYKILIVDDVVENIQVCMNVLKEDGYSLSFATNAKDGLELAKNEMFDLILLDIMMPVMDGFTFCTQLKHHEHTKDIPVIFLTAKVDVDSISRGFKVGAVDYITKPFNADELLMRVKNHIELYCARQVLKQNNINLEKKLEVQNIRINTELEQTQKEMIYILTELMESTSDETGKHIKRVAQISQLLAKYHESLSEEDEQTIYHAAPMHDIGKVAIDSNIIHKADRLTAEEFETIKSHTTIAHNFLQYSDRKIIKAADIIAYQHHEKYDGTGYPNGLVGEQIHLFGRIAALADVFDALTHKRIYKDAWSIDEAVAYIKEHKGTQFDPYLVDIFLEHIDEFVLIAQES